jgi:hypothetical protein
VASTRQIPRAIAWWRAPGGLICDWRGMLYQISKGTIDIKAKGKSVPLKIGCKVPFYPYHLSIENMGMPELNEVPCE